MRRRSTKDNNTTDCYVKLTKLNLDNSNIYESNKKSEKMTKTRRSNKVAAAPVVVEETISTRAKRTPKPNRRYLDSADKIDSRENSPDRRGNVKKNAQSDDEVVTVKKSVSKISTAPKTEPIKKSVSRVVLSKEKELKSSTPIRSLRNNDSLTSKRKIDTEIDEKKPPAKKMKDSSIDEEPVRRLTRQTKTELTPVVNKSTTITKKVNVSKIEVPTKISKEIMPKKIVEPVITAPAIKSIKKSIEPEAQKFNISTDIDFEDEVPSFKIVNVNDIIMQKKGDEIKSTNDDKKIQLRSKPKPKEIYYELSEVEDYDDDDSYDGDFDNERHSTSDDTDDDVPLRRVVKRNNSNSSNSRRKAQHTKILSDDDKTAALNAKKKIPDYASTRLNLRNRLNESLGNIKLKAAENPTTSTPKPKLPPKILNSTLGSKSPSKFTPIISRVVAQGGPASKQQKNILTPKKLTNNNVRTYKNSHKLPVKNNTVVSKNITCVEKWFVMNYSNEDIGKVITTKHQSLLTLTQLGNEMKNIKLPSDNWSYKILLEKKPNKENQKKTTEVYTGEVQDPTIDDSEKHNYHPINILFKRKNSDASSKIQSDRTVVFKGSTYSITMDGINVKLIGAPVILYNIQEIQTLLQIMDDVSLINSYVEKIYNNYQ